ncbi:hypothetical protein IW140_002159 [Coemansia sp. RSA 1813]|nr:hypothetical protein EV178_001308 [Coemansia sp. RSA 1646]KAJ1770243.1 hypothetical protein LPJ74_003388 [Coemansia sp. RSA 1843]KAJ2090200.1 hypothetical protein IW138_002832 [Coemansia sp. RSA 986]KAJ2214606.1 hypothetical protein EV179_002865 [Coemansia sp. RSA 487]KAJ2570733.1 hypothetical protein IW140_002159 [Coemansia sp. RSA 1813]
MSLLVLALAFYLGYRYASTKQATQPEAQQQADPDSVNRKPKKVKAKKQQKQQKPTQGSQQPPRTDPPPKPKKQPTEKKQPKSTAANQPEEPDFPDHSPAANDPLPSPPAEWEPVRRTDSARTAKKPTTAIPVHQTRWADLDSDENLDHDLNPEPTQPRVLRIGAPAGPPRREPPRIHYDPPEPKKLTKKQRQTQRQMQKRREERAEATAIQEQRLREHRRQLEETRSREQWEKAKRAKAKKQQQQGGGGGQQGAAPSCIDGKLIWD